MSLRDGLIAVIDVGQGSNTGGLLGLLVGGSFLAFLGALLSARSGRQRKFDERIDADNTRLRKRVNALEDENDTLRAWIVRQGADPEEVLRDRQA